MFFLHEDAKLQAVIKSKNSDDCFACYGLDPTHPDHRNNRVDCSEPIPAAKWATPAKPATDAKKTRLALDPDKIAKAWADRDATNRLLGDL